MKLSPAQAALLHTLESAASSAILTFIVGLVQYLSTHALSWPDLATVFASGFVAAFGLIYKSVITSPNLQQAEADTASAAVAEAKSLAQQALGHIENIWPALHALNTQQAATPVVQPVSVPQVPFQVTGSTYQQPSLTNNPITLTYNTATGTATVAPQNMVSLPQRSFTESALMPAVPKQ